jgi:hypothetical protein
MPSQYPTYDIGGPKQLRCQIIDKTYPVVEGPKFQDGGQDTFLPNQTPTITWELAYEGLLQSEVATLDSHNDSAFNAHLSFNFRDPETGTLYAGVKYAQYQRGTRTKTWLNARVVRLIKRP